MIHFLKGISLRPCWIQKHEPGPLLLLPAEVHRVQLLWLSAVPTPWGRPCSPASGSPGPSVSEIHFSTLYPLSSHLFSFTFDVTVISFYSAAAKLLQLCPTLCDPIDSSPPGSLVPGVLQARALEWVAISFSSAWKWKVKVKSLSRALLLVTP